ncbi:MAG TPA: hypothetical protein P5069_14055, partial [Candidatus Hydrogenedentes bacterium]|nr:hypothetical protein [Candidatus Hydrogenedentota bacterium]
MQDLSLAHALLVCAGALAGAGVLIFLFRRADRARRQHLAAVLARQPVRAGEAFRLTFARSTSEALRAYLRVDLEYPGIEGAFRVRSTLRALAAGRVVAEEVLGAWGDRLPMQGVTREWTRRYYLDTRPWKDGYRDSVV